MTDENKKEDYKDFLRSDLEEELEKRDLSTKGNVDVLRKRLIKDDKESGTDEDAEQEEEDKPEETPTAPAPKAKAGKTGFDKKSENLDVIDRNGRYMRTYNEKDHGKGYAELAIGFAAKVKGRTIRNGDETNSIVVHYQEPEIIGENQDRIMNNRVVLKQEAFSGDDFRARAVAFAREKKTVDLIPVR